jgi:hypothetical protein
MKESTYSPTEQLLSQMYKFLCSQWFGEDICKLVISGYPLNAYLTSANMFTKIVIFDGNLAGSRMHGWSGNEVYATFVVFKNGGVGVCSGQ